MPDGQRQELPVVALALALAFAGCGSETGLMLDVDGPAGPAAIASLDFVIAHQSFCERWVGDPTTTVDVSGRDLTAAPYQLLARPAHVTNLDDPVLALVLARDASGQVVGAAEFAPRPFRLHEVVERHAQLELLRDPGQASYLASDGCVCLPGAPWIGNGSGGGCDNLVVTSFARLVDTAGCELPSSAPQSSGAVCDGQLYPDEAQDRALPCFATSGGACRVDTRACADHDGVAYAEECAVADAAPALPDGKLCQAYAQCQAQACGDLVGCLRAAIGPPQMLHCTLFMDPTAATPTPCGGGVWQAPLTTQDGACVAVMLDGVQQPPFTLGFVSADQAGAQPIGACPVTLTVDALQPMSPLELDVAHVFHLTIGDQLVDLTIDIQQSCGQSAPLVCHS